MEHSAVTLDELDAMLRAACDYVQQRYLEFHTAFENKYMKEVGLTDLFMTRLAAWLHQQHKTGVIDWSHDENKDGADFEIWVKIPSQNQGEFTYRVIYFQAKVFRRNTQGLKTADFFYESTHNKVKNFQLALFAKFAEAEESDAYYVIYDWEGVTFVDAHKLLRWVRASNAVRSEQEWNAKVIRVFAEPTIRLASDVIPPQE